MISSFWCDKCKRDVTADAHREVYTWDKKPDEAPDVIWAALCPKRHKIVRYITNRHLDPYFRKSEELRIQRKVYAKDLLQPGQPGFATNYPEQQKEIEKAEEEAFNKDVKFKKDYAILQRKYGHNPEYRRKIKEVFAQEEAKIYGT